MTQPPRIRDYAVIGDGRSAALVSKDGSVDWLCWPRFDSPSLFAAILDPESGGRCVLRPREPARAQRRYLGDSNVLSTRFDTARGRGRLIDLMPVMSEDAKRRELVPEHELLRMFECELGQLELEVLFQPRPGYGRSPVTLKRAAGLGLRVEDGSSLYTLRCDVPLELSSDGTVAKAVVRLEAGQRVHLSLTYDSEGPAVLPPLAEHAPLAIARSVSWWQRWVARCTYHGPYRAQVVRSVLALKLMTFAPSGAIVAAPTTSLPEVEGGDLNWDYRFCWLRDASLTVTALHDLGYESEALAFMSWMLHTTSLTRPELSVLYDVYGRLPRPEEELRHLSGHCGAKPVRIRNGAASQRQLDIYGEVVDAVARLVRRGMTLTREEKKMLRGIARYVSDHWSEPDAGIWERRGDYRFHTHSLLSCWVAADRLLELHAAGHLRGVDAASLEIDRDAMAATLRDYGWNEQLGAYTDLLDGDTVDASLLLMSWYGFEPPWHPRQRSTFAKMRERLEPRPGLLKRWEGARDGAFGICCFWAVQHLADGGGTLEEAEGRLRLLLSYANDVGLYAEETEPRTGAPMGNFPQAFTHVGLIQAALAVEKRRAHERRRRVA